MRGIETPLVKMVNIHKRFGAVQALEGVDFMVPYKAVVGLLGDNGAGKSTLIKILLGVFPPDEGEIYFEGKRVQFSSPEQARAIGIEPVYQNLGLIESISIARNFFLGRELTKKLGFFKFLDMKRMRQISMDRIKDVGVRRISSADETVSALSGGERQSICIGRAIHFSVKLLVLDEPTTALSIRESEKVLEYINEARERGVSVIFITHNVHHVYPIADKFTILDEGVKVADLDKKDVISADEISNIISKRKR